MRTWICIGILALCSLSCGEEVAQPQAPPAPTIDDLVLANMLDVQEAAEAFAVEAGGAYPYSLQYPWTPDGRNLVDFLPGGTELTNPVTGQATDPVFFEPDSVGSTSYRGVWHYDEQWLLQRAGYVIIGRGESADMTITNAPDSLIQLDVQVVENCYLVQAAAEAYAADNDGVYGADGASRNPVGKRLTDYLPGGMLLMNPYTRTRIDPNWGGSALVAGGVGYLSVDVNADGIMDGYYIDGLTGIAWQIILLCGGPFCI